MRIEIALLLSEHPIWQGSDKQREITLNGVVNLQLLNNSSLSWTLQATAACGTHPESKKHFLNKKTFYFFHVPTTRYLLAEGRNDRPYKTPHSQKCLANATGTARSFLQHFARRWMHFFLFL